MKKEEIAYNRGYYVNEEGILYNPKGKEIGNKVYQPYRFTNIRIDGKKHRITIHRLQAYQKYKNDLYKKDIEVRHINGNSNDNSINNIELGTHSENMLDIPKDIRTKNALYASSFLKKYDNDAIKLYYLNNKSYKKTMLHFNITSKGTLHYILNN